MQNANSNVIKSDVLIIGSGLAGLLLAIKLVKSGLSITLATKGALLESNTSLAQGGVAAVLDATPFDSPEEHLADTLKSGAGLSDEDAAKVIITSGNRLITELCKLGVTFDIADGSGFHMAREGGHSQARVLHSKDATGLNISQSLTKSLIDLAQQSKTNQSITILQNAFALDLIESNGRCHGADLAVAGAPVRALAGSTVLATGGAGQLFSRTTNPPVATADGVALAYRAGARIIDLEFMQFHPTALALPDAPTFLISEAIRGAGAVLLDARGQRFAFRFHEMGELATRDIVAKAIHTVMQEQELEHVDLDLRPIGATTLEARFPNIVSFLRGRGIDPLIETVPVAPAAHYFMGGIAATADGVTSLPGLYAIGECASTGLHGANRLASNSLLEAGVMAIHLHERLLEQPARIIPDIVPTHTAPRLAPSSLESMRNSMFKWCSLVRGSDSLRFLRHELDDLSRSIEDFSPGKIEASNMLLTASLMATAAEKRTESRGSHYRKDYPTKDDARFLKRLCVESGSWRWLDIGSRPLSTTLIRPDAVLKP